MIESLLLSQLMLLPVLAIFVWIYTRLRPAAAARRVLVVFDCAVVIMALALSAAGLMWVADLSVDGASPVCR